MKKAAQMSSLLHSCVKSPIITNVVRPNLGKLLFDKSQHEVEEAAETVQIGHVDGANFLDLSFYGLGLFGTLGLEVFVNEYVPHLLGLRFCDVVEFLYMVFGQDAHLEVGHAEVQHRVPVAEIAQVYPQVLFAVVDDIANLHVAMDAGSGFRKNFGI